MVSNQSPGAGRIPVPRALNDSWWWCLGGIAINQALGWVVLARQAKPEGFSLAIDLLLLEQALFFLVFGIAFARTVRPVWRILVGAVLALDAFVYEFSVMYWNAGSRANWSIPLSRLDAIYLALGTLTTAGASGITPRTETARVLATAQLGAEVLLVPLLLGLLTAALIRIRGD